MMKPGTRSATVLLVGLLTVAVTAGDVYANLQGPGRVARKRLSSSVVQITVYDWRGIFVRQGWGFFINKEGHIITPRSLLEGGFYVEATTVKRETFVINKVLAEDPDRNFIRLGLEYPPERFAYLEKSSSLPSVGERILVGGGQGCEPGAFLDGVIEDVRKVPLFGFLVKVGSPFATTGSPIFNEKGVLVGVVMFRLEGGADSAWAVPVGGIAQVMGDTGPPLDHLAWAERRQGAWLESTVGSYVTGLAYYWTGQHGRAMPRLERATADERFRREAFFLLGCCNDAVGRFEDSADAYSMAIGLGESSHEVYMNLARALLLQGEKQEALNAAWAAIRVRPNCYEAFTLLGEIYNSMGNYSEALAGIYVAIRMDPRKPDAYHQQGISLRGEKKYSEAIGAFRRCIDLDPGYTRAYWDLALTYYRSGDRRSAAEICETLKKVDPALSIQLLTEVTR